MTPMARVTTPVCIWMHRPDCFQQGLFNGAKVHPNLYHGSYFLNLTFLEPVGPAGCVVATAYPLNAIAVSTRFGNCKALDGGKGGGKPAQGRR